VSGAAASDINQGCAGTCYLVASLGAIAGVNGAMITDAVIDNANGSYGVRFYLDGAPVYVTVDQNVPVTGTNRVALSSNVEHSLSGESWVSLIEKAYAQLNAQANINNAGNGPAKPATRRWRAAGPIRSSSSPT
jgi:Calpain family cysteine protease